MSNTTNASGGGIGFFGAMALMFIGLKLTGYIDWSWWWVLAPLWAPIAVGAVGCLVFLCAYVGIGVSWQRLQAWRARRRQLQWRLERERFHS